MTKKIKDIIIGFCTAFLLCCAVGLTSFNVSALAYADEQVLTVEEYTSSDHLLKANGEESVKTIYDFSDEVKNAVAGAAFPELAEVIPAEYLESNIYNETFFYNGQEYGFYVVKEGMYFDVLLIDFKYDFDNGSQSDLEYKIRIEPILQQSFYRLETSNGEYNWYKYGGVDRYRYYVANPRFLSTIQNENALNYGDNGYSKQDDEGVIILQSRANYGKISYKTEKDLLGSVLEFTGDQIVGAVFGALDEVTGNVASVIKDSVEFAVTLYEEGKEVTVEANNERNISTRQSKTAQRMNEDIGGYSRVAAFMPTEEIVLSADINSYAEFITVLGDANYRSRLSEFCDFDIVRRNNDYASMQYVAGAGDNTDFSFKKISTLYDDQTITSLKSNTVTQQELAYFLKKGEHKFSYHCEDTTIYQFESNTQLSDISVYCNGIPVQVTELDSDTVEVLLEKGEDYEIIFSQENAGYYYFTFCKKASEINTLGTQAVQALTSGASAWFSYQSNQSKYLSISYDASKYNLEVCFVDNNGTNAYIDCNSVENQKEFFVQAGNKYYVWFSNKKTTNISSSTWEINEVETLPFNSTSDSFAVNGKRVFKFIAPVEGKYEIKGLPFGMSATMNAEYNGSYYLLSAGEYYVTVTGNTASTTCSIEFVSQQISLTALSPNTVSGGAKNVFIKFVPPVSLNYALVLPANISLEHIISENTILQTTDNSNMSLEANKTYYFRVVAVSGNLPAQFYLMIMPQITGVLDVNQATGNGSLSLNGSGEQVIKIGVTEINIYEFMGFENATLYNTYLQPIDMNSVLTAGTYYMTVNFNSGNVHNLQVYRKGKVMQIGDVIGVAGPGTYKYQLVKNNVYEIRIGASSDHTFTTNITLRDSLGTECVIDKEGEYYTFTATDTTMFMDLEMYNVAGQAGVLTLLEVNTTSGSIIQTIYPESLYPLAMDESKCIIKIPAGQYKLHVQKSLTDNIKLYEINGVYTNMRTGNPVNNSTGIEYLVSSTSERVYIIHSDNVEVTCLLSYNDGSEYKIEVQEESPDSVKYFV